MKTYEIYKEKEVTLDILNSIAVGDLIKVNDWKKPLRVMGVSENYFVMATKQFGETIYSVCEKKRWDGIKYNRMVGGMFHCGCDSWVFGWDGSYDFRDEKNTAAYLQSFEVGDSELSQRSAIAITEIAIKRERLF